MIPDLSQCGDLYQTLVARPPRIVRGTIALLVAILATAAAWAGCTEVDVVAKAGGVIRPASDTVKIQSPAAGRIREARVRAGDRVSAGDVLLRLDTETTEAEIDKLRKAIEAGDREVRDLEDLRVTTREEARLLRSQSDLEVQTAREASETAEREVDRLRPLADQGVVARREVEKLETSSREARLRLEGAERNRETKERSSAARAQELEIRIASRRAGVEEQRDTLRVLELERQRATLTSPIDGVVSVGEPMAGNVVTAGQVLLEIVPEEGLRFDASVPSSEIAGVRVGSRARIKLDAYEFQKYGAIEGEICYVSPDARMAEGRGAMYTVRIRIDRPVFGPLHAPIELGMTGRVEIVKGRDRLLHAAFRRAREGVTP